MKRSISHKSGRFGHTAVICFVGLSWLSLSRCGGASSTPATEDISVSGAVVSTLGGVVSGTEMNGTLARIPPHDGLFQKWLAVPSALASSTCPTLKAGGTGCSASGSSMWLTYAGCEFFASSATWTGTQSLTMSSGTPSCGSFPNPGSGQVLARQLVASAGSSTRATATRVNSFGTSVTVDNASTNLKNFDGATIAPVANGGYGAQVTFGAQGIRTSIVIAERFYATAYDHSVTGTAAVTETAGQTSRTLSGTFIVYDNVLKVKGVSTFTGLTHTDGCCLPTAGTITTAFEAGANVSPASTAAQSYVGKTETLVLSGCGAGTLTDINNSTTSITLANCF
jgi:hypothetical protein